MADAVRAAASRGFTMVELIAVIAIAGVLAAVAMPRLDGISGITAEAYRDSLVAGLRHAQSIAYGHRRLVCAQVNGQSQLVLRIADTYGATACTQDLPGPDGSAVFARPPAGIGVVVVPASTLYFQSSGGVSSSAGAISTSDFTLTATGLAAITVRGTHGLVE